MINILLFTGLAIALLVALWLEGKWFMMGLHGTPDARTALVDRFRADSRWRDVATGLSALAGVLIVYWLWFG